MFRNASQYLMILAVLVITGLSPRAAEARDWGIGIMAGEPTGLSYKNWFDERHAFDLGVAWSFEDDGAFHLHGDYLWHFRDRIDDVESGNFALYVGLGGRIDFEDDRDDEVGIRIPVGVAFETRNAPLDVFLEIVPILDLAPESELDMNASIGVRFWFSSRSEDES